MHAYMWGAGRLTVVVGFFPLQGSSYDGMSPAVAGRVH
jgi:hypothetical protein